MTEDLLSVIIPVYNAEKFLERCLDSVIGQTYTNIEIILIDDGSTDDSAVICDNYAKKDCRISVIHKKNEGASIARNIGLEHSKGRYIMFVDADDRVENNIAEKLYTMIISDHYDVSICQIQGVGDAGREYGVNFQRSLPEDILKPPSPVAKLFDREIIGNLRFKDYRLEEDLLFLVDMLCEHQNLRTIYCRDILYYYTVNDASLTHGGLDEDVFAGLKLEIECYERLQKCGVSVQNTNLITSALFRILQKYSMLPKEKRTECELYYRECRRCAKRYRACFIKDNSFSFVANIPRLLLYFFPQVYVCLYKVRYFFMTNSKAG